MDFPGFFLIGTLQMIGLSHRRLFSFSDLSSSTLVTRRGYSIFTQTRGEKSKIFISMVSIVVRACWKKVFSAYTYYVVYIIQKRLFWKNRNALMYPFHQLIHYLLYTFMKNTSPLEYQFIGPKKKSRRKILNDFRRQLKIVNLDLIQFLADLSPIVDAGNGFNHRAFSLGITILIEIRVKMAPLLLAVFAHNPRLYRLKFQLPYKTALKRA